MVEWVLPGPIKPGGKQVMQARLSVDEAEVRVVAIPPTAPAMVKCHLKDSTFSSVQLEVLAPAGEGNTDVPGKVVKRSRIQSKQQA